MSSAHSMRSFIKRAKPPTDKEPTDRELRKLWKDLSISKPDRYPLKPFGIIQKKK